MMYKNIIFHTKSTGVATITLNKPEVYNSLNEEIILELIGAFEHCTNSNDIKVIVLTGSGRGFCSGQDLKDILADVNLSPSSAMKKTYNPLILKIREIPKPVICRLNGAAVGAGCSLAIACDVVIASEEAILSEAFIQIGLVPDSGSTYFVPRLTGRIRAFELLTKGAKISAPEAVNLGLITKCVPSNLLDKEVEAWTAYYLNSPLVAVGLIKKMLNQSYHQTLVEVLDTEAEIQDIAAQTNDFQEGVSAFKEKRKAIFKGS